MQPILAHAATHLDEDVSLTALAELFGLSASHLQRIFAATIGESPKQITLRLRLEHAAAMLLTTACTVLDIAHSIAASRATKFSAAHSADALA